MFVLFLFADWLPLLSPLTARGYYAATFPIIVYDWQLYFTACAVIRSIFILYSFCYRFLFFSPFPPPFKTIDSLPTVNWLFNMQFRRHRNRL